MYSKTKGLTLLILILWGCAQNQSHRKPLSELIENPLKGKWKLEKRKLEPDTAYRLATDSVEYIKILTDKSFVWYTYSKNDRHVIAMGGGSYSFEGESYTESLEFYYPPGTGMEGSTIPFRCLIKDGQWHHAGYLNEREFDEEINDYVVIKERRLEEVWTKVE